MSTDRDMEVCRVCRENWIDIHLRPRKNVDHVEIFVMVAAVFMIALSIGAPRRRQSQSIIIRYGVEGVFILSYPLIIYTLGLMGGQHVFRSELYPVWGMFLAMLFGGTNAMSFKKLDENKHTMKLYWNYLLLMFYMGTMSGLFLIVGNRRPSIWFIAISFNLLFVIKSLEQWGAANLAKKPSEENGIPRLAFYMKFEHQHDTMYDPHTMHGYKYPVLIHVDTPVTLDKIWFSDIGAFSSSSSSPSISRLKDLCLSFSLFHLVVRRYFGYTCPESNLDKTRDLVLHGLLATEQEYERAFQVIEAELAFLYDFFFTKYAYIMYGREVLSCAGSLGLILLSIAVGAGSLHVLNPHPSLLDDLWVETSPRDFMVTKVALGVLLMFQLLQILSYCVSDWAMVSWACKYVAHPSWQGNARIKKLLLLLGKRPKCLRYWRNTIGQYSVLDSFDSGYQDRLKRLFQSRKSGKPIELPLEVKGAVALHIKNSITVRLSDIASPLIKRGMSNQLCWACQISSEFTLTQIILVWHIATSYCEISEKIRYQEQNIVHPNRRVATSLSKYIAYLIAFAPRLLPGSHIESECTLDNLEGEVKGLFQNLGSPREKYQKLIQLQYLVDERQATSAQLLNKGALLGKQLESIGNPAMLWDLLADFWAEMTVYVAPSDNVAGHIELLAEGGEFLTHVWALLMHAGILEWPAAAAVP